MPTQFGQVGLREYVPAMDRRSKWQTPFEQHFKTGDLVWIVKKRNLRNYYPTTLIEELQYGFDGVSRSRVIRVSFDHSFVRLTQYSRPEDVRKYYFQVGKSNQYRVFEKRIKYITFHRECSENPHPL